MSIDKIVNLCNIETMIRRIDKILDEYIRIDLKAHGGNIEIIDYDNDRLFIQLTGGCQGCSSSQATLKGGVEKIIFQHFPEVKEVVDLTDHRAGEKPYM